MNKLNLLVVISLAFVSMALIGCETLDGAGQDIENAGEAVQDAAN